MAFTKIETPTAMLTSDTVYKVNESYYEITPYNVSGNVTYYVKNHPDQADFALTATFNAPIILHISRFTEFKFLFAGTDASLTLCNHFSYRG